MACHTHKHTHTHVRRQPQTKWRHKNNVRACKTWTRGASLSINYHNKYKLSHRPTIMPTTQEQQQKQQLLSRATTAVKTTTTRTEQEQQQCAYAQAPFV